MRIAELRTHVLEAPLQHPFGWSVDRTTVRKSCIVEIVTDTGITGWGECFGPARPNAAVVNGFRHLLIGADPLASDVIWQDLYNRFRDQGQKGLVISGLSGVDIALWDIRGKHFGAPVHRLMGGPMRTRVQAYATGTYRLDEGDPLDYVIDEVRQRVSEGFHGVKLKIGIDFEEDIALIKAARRAVGPEIRLMLDANHAYDATEAIALGRRVAGENIDWFEEPVVPEQLAAYREVRARQPIPVAGGETWHSRWGMREPVETRAVDILQPDLAGVGGFTEAKRVADLAALHGIRVVPHVWGTAVHIAAALQFMAAMVPSPVRVNPIEPILEFDRTHNPFRQAVIKTPIEHEHGVVRIPNGPGLGIEINRDTLAEFRMGGI